MKRERGVLKDALSRKKKNFLEESILEQKKNQQSTEEQFHLADNLESCNYLLSFLHTKACKQYCKELTAVGNQESVCVISNVALWKSNMALLVWKEGSEFSVVSCLLMRVFKSVTTNMSLDLSQIT